MVPRSCTQVWCKGDGDHEGEKGGIINVTLTLLSCSICCGVYHASLGFQPPVREVQRQGHPPLSMFVAYAFKHRGNCSSTLMTVKKNTKQNSLKTSSSSPRRLVCVVGRLTTVTSMTYTVQRFGCAEMEHIPPPYVTK